MSLNSDRNLSIPRWVACALWLLVAAGWARSGVAEGWAPAPVPWDFLLFETSNTLGRVSAQVELGSPTDRDPKLGSGAGNHGPVLLPESGKVLLLRTGIEAEFQIFPGMNQRKQWTGRAWFLAEQGTALQRIRFKPGREGSFKQYRYGQEGVYRKRMEPKGRAEANLSPEQWSRVKDSFYPYTADGTRCERILDPLTLLYVLSAADWSAVNQWEFCVFNKQGLYLVQLEKAGGERLKVAFKERRGESTRSVERALDARDIRLTSRPLDPGAKDLDPFEFLGFEGDVQILLEAESGIPLRLTGKIPSIGSVELHLTKAGLVR